MIYRILADLILTAHFGFIVFVIFGGLLVLYRRFVLWLHLPALVWGILIEFFRLTCPLTTLENYLRQLGGEDGYEGGFIEHYVSALVYWQMTAQRQILLGVVLIAFNLLIYFFVFQKSRARFTDL
ncbi:MAG: DUF2784 domain-containing protein [Pyrinomonadaceae bacterium]